MRWTPSPGRSANKLGEHSHRGRPTLTARPAYHFVRAVGRSDSTQTIKYKTGTGNSGHEESFTKPYSPFNAAIAGTRVARKAGSDDATTTTMKRSAGART
jgi:hypothetical protein